jgi:hypothetical protein
MCLESCLIEEILPILTNGANIVKMLQSSLAFCVRSFVPLAEEFNGQNRGRNER